MAINYSSGGLKQPLTIILETITFASDLDYFEDKFQQFRTFRGNMVCKSPQGKSTFGFMNSFFNEWHEKVLTSFQFDGPVSMNLLSIWLLEILSY